MADGINDRFDFTAAPMSLAGIRRVHIIAIGGSGMSAVARLLLARGIEVSGSDAKDSATLRALAEQGAAVRVGHDARMVYNADLVVISSAIGEDNVELAKARANGVPVAHRAHAVAMATEGLRRVAVAGANGKTTTSAMIVAALVAAGAAPSFAVGADLPGIGVNAALGSGADAVIEADESDASFLVYRPEVAVVTSVQPDHLDFYGTFERVRQAYSDFVASLQAGGLLVACADDPGSADLARADAAQGGAVVTYGVDPSAEVRLSDPVDAVLDPLSGFGASATLTLPGHPPVRLELSVPGRHNLLDAAAAVAAAVLGCGAELEPVLAGLRDFTGARRRFEVVGRVGEVTVIDDYAHNPGKVAALVGTAVDLVGRERVQVVFQPHLFSRTRDFAAQFGAGLARAGRVVLLPIYGAREEAMAGVTSDLLVEAIRAADPTVLVDLEPDRGKVAARVAAQSVPGDLVLVVGAGDVTAVAPQILTALEGSD